MGIGRQFRQHQPHLRIGNHFPHQLRHLCACDKLMVRRLVAAGQLATLRTQLRYDTRRNE